jgi:hypothetical protein
MSIRYLTQNFITIWLRSDLNNYNNTTIDINIFRVYDTLSSLPNGPVIFTLQNIFFVLKLFFKLFN